MIVGMYLVYREAKKHKISEDTMTNLIFYTIVIAIIGARLYYVIFNWDYYSKHLFEILEIWNGGLAIHGAIILGGIYLFYFTHKKKINTLKMLDICAVGVIIGQAIGRWGNFFNQEAYGSVTSLEFLKSLFLPQFIIDGMHINGVYYQPTFLYESIWCIIGFIIMLVYRKRKYLKVGQIFGIYCAWYGLGRFFIEGMRQDSLMLGSFKMAQIVSVIMIIVGIYFFVRRLKSGRFEHLYYEENGLLSSSQTNNVTTFQTNNTFIR